MSVAIFAHGTQLKRGDGATSETFTEIPLAGDITFDKPETELIPYPDQSDSTLYRKSIAGMKSGGKVTAPLSFNPGVSVHVALDTQHGSIGNFQIVCPGTPSYTFSFAALVNIQHNFPEDKHWLSTLTLSITGAVTRA